MSTKYVQQGSVIDHTPAFALSSDDVVVMGSNGEAIIGVALNDIAANQAGPVQIDGVFELPKVSAAVIAQGESVNWDASAGAFDDNQATAASGDVAGCCVAVEAAGDGDTTVKVKLNVGVGALTA